MIGRVDFFPGAPKREPSAEQRQGAIGLHEIYTAHVEAGFTKQQAMDIVLEMVRASIAQQRPRPPG